MPQTSAPKDRFDELPEDGRRLGAHRAENPGVRAGAVLLWAAVATVVLVVVGVAGTMFATGRITLFPTAAATAESTVTAVPTAEPVLDTSYTVLILNATPQDGLAGEMREVVVAAGWSEDAVIDGDAGSEDFETTTVYYATADDEGAARGLAQAIGGAEVQLNDVYQIADDTSTTDVDESASAQLVIVIGLDRVDGADASTTP
ncbi:MAG: LytR C-terminal domain-containing protein [Microbacterium sp.]